MRRPATPTGRQRPLRPALLAAVLVVVSGAACGGGSGGDGGRPAAGPGETAPAADTPASTAPPVDVSRRVAARWEAVTTLSGPAAADSAPFSIEAAAIQWRAKWSCQSGALRISTVPPPKRPGALVESGCPGTGEAFSIQTGEIRLRVEAAGPWSVTIDKQVETPLNEPPLAEMASAPVLARGEFYNIEKSGKGTAQLYGLPGGRRALRLEGFEVSQNTDLFVWLSEAPRPRTSAEVVAAPYVEISGLKSTAGPQNYLVPPELGTDRIQSVVIWCAPLRIAYVAAALSGP